MLGKRRTRKAGTILAWSMQADSQERRAKAGEQRPASTAADTPSAMKSRREGVRHPDPVFFSDPSDERVEVYCPSRPLSDIHPSSRRRPAGPRRGRSVRQDICHPQTHRPRPVGASTRLPHSASNPSRDGRRARRRPVDTPSGRERYERIFSYPLGPSRSSLAPLLSPEKRTQVAVVFSPPPTRPPRLGPCPLVVSLLHRRNVASTPHPTADERYCAAALGVVE